MYLVHVERKDPPDVLGDVTNGRGSVDGWFSLRASEDNNNGGNSNEGISRTYSYASSDINLSFQDFAWLEQALRLEYQGGLLFPLLSPWPWRGQ